MPIDAFSYPDNTVVKGKFSVQDDPSGNKGTLSLDNGNITSDAAGNLTTVGLISGSGGIRATSGGLVVTSGAQSLLGSKLQLNEGSIQTPTGAAQTITTTNIVNRTAPSGACTAAILAAGTVDGQIIAVTNESTVVANTITFSTTLATGLILTDATPDAHVIKASSGALFIWLASLNSGNGAWVRMGPFGG